jgi:hypothetical protein
MPSLNLCPCLAELSQWPGPEEGLVACPEIRWYMTIKDSIDEPSALSLVNQTIQWPNQVPWSCHSAVYVRNTWDWVCGRVQHLTPGVLFCREVIWNHPHNCQPKTNIICNFELIQCLPGPWEMPSLNLCSCLAELSLWSGPRRGACGMSWNKVIYAWRRIDQWSAQSNVNQTTQWPNQVPWSCHSAVYVRNTWDWVSCALLTDWAKVPKESHNVEKKVGTRPLNWFCGHQLFPAHLLRRTSCNASIVHRWHWCDIDCGGAVEERTKSMGFRSTFWAHFYSDLDNNWLHEHPTVNIELQVLIFLLRLSNWIWKCCSNGWAT